MRVFTLKNTRILFFSHFIIFLLLKNSHVYGIILTYINDYNTLGYMEKILNEFIDICHNNFVNCNGDETTKSSEYISLRTISKESIDVNKIGYCYKDQFIPNEILFFGREEEDWGYRSQIAKKIILPVFAEFNNIVGFATHAPIMEKEYVWWNLPKPFYKGNHLFLLNKTRREIYDKNKVYLVEGYVDAILLYQHGLRNVAALMGTSLTQRKISLIMRYCNNICFCLDSDENQSGQNARDKSISIVDEFDFCDSISTIDLPIGEDPASYVSKHGIESLVENEQVLTHKEILEIKRLVKSKSKKH